MAPKKRKRARKEIPEIKAPMPAREAPVKLIGPFFWKRMAVLLVILMVIIIISGIAFVAISSSKEKKELEKRLLGFEEKISGTQIQLTKDTIEQMIASGTMAVPKADVLSGTEKDYICTITTDQGIITLKKRGSLMREEIIRSSYNLSVLFLGDKLYFYHPVYNLWAMFPYDPEKITSYGPHTGMAFSMAELRAINESDYRCIETELPEDEFSLEEIEVADAPEFLESMRLIK